jgi:hypothetical protein
MLNAGRRIDFAIFTLDEAVKIGGAQLEPGLQQIHQVEGFYYFKKVDSPKPYAKVSLSENIAVLRILFSNQMFTGM